MVGEVIFMNKKGVQSFDGERVKPLSHFVAPAVKTDEERKNDFERWSRLRPVYFSTWMWEVACRREPHKYKMFLPVYKGSDGQDQKVMLT